MSPAFTQNILRLAWSEGCWHDTVGGAKKMSDGDGMCGWMMVGVWVTKQQSAFSDHHLSPLFGSYWLALDISNSNAGHVTGPNESREVFWK